MDQLLVYPLSEGAIVISFGEAISLEIHKQVIAVRQALENKPFEGYIESVPAFNTLTIYYDANLPDLFGKNHGKCSANSMQPLFPFFMLI